MARMTLRLALVSLLAGAGAAAAATRPADGIPRLGFGYEASAPLAYVDRGRVSRRAGRVAVHDVSFRSQGRRIRGYLLLPPGKGRHAAVVFVHGSGADRAELLDQAALLAARNLVTLTITEPSTSSPPTPATDPNRFLAQARDVQVRDVVAVRRAVDALRSLPAVDPSRIGYLGWSAGARTGTFVAAAEPRVKALVLLSAGAAPLSAFVSQAPRSLRAAVRRTLGSVDPIRYIAWARPRTVMLENGTKDEVVPHSALLNIVRAAPKGTTVRWYRAPHELNAAAYRAAFDWLAQKLRS